MKEKIQKILSDWKTRKNLLLKEMKDNDAISTDDERCFWYGAIDSYRRCIKDLENISKGLG